MFKFDCYRDGVWYCSLESDSYKATYYAARLTVRCDAYMGHGHVYSMATKGREVYRVAF